jgi:hypothetical protein
LWGSTRSRSGTSTCDSSQSMSAPRFVVKRTLPGLLGLPRTTHVWRPMSRAHAVRHRAMPSGGIAPRSTFVPVSACRRSVDDRQPGRCGQPCVNWCSRRSVSATRRQSAAVSGDPPSTYLITTKPSANSRPSVVGIGTGTVRPSRSRCWRPTRDQRRSCNRDDRPRGARGRGRSTRRRRLRQRVVRCELHLHPSARVLPITLCNVLIETGCPRMWLATWPGTRAKRFYRNTGWHVTGQDDGNLNFEHSQPPSNANV